MDRGRRAARPSSRAGLLLTTSRRQALSLPNIPEAWSQPYRPDVYRRGRLRESSWGKPPASGFGACSDTGGELNSSDCRAKLPHRLPASHDKDEAAFWPHLDKSAMAGVTQTE